MLLNMAFVLMGNMQLAVGSAFNTQLRQADDLFYLAVGTLTDGHSCSPKETPRGTSPHWNKELRGWGAEGGGGSNLNHIL